MLYIFMGPSCSGKSSAAEELKNLMDVEIYAGKDYLRMSKNEQDAWKVFSGKLKEASSNRDLNSPSIIYIISEKSDISKLQGFDNALTIKFTADFETVKSRFANRMKGNLPKPVEKMIERQLMDWENVNAKMCVNSSVEGAKDIAKKVYDATL